ncbi:MAG TPA: hypothetical protein ENH91_02205 [Leeuwenhoekiella sp.]|nr:hypothetical protein [Leeuwenhoekiella sp.]
MIRKVFLSVLVLFMPISVFSQSVKNEVEKRITKEEMPAEALRRLEQMPIKLEKARLYLEQDNEHRSVEAKVAHKGKKYSIEFEKTGNLHDIEVVITLDEIPKYIAKTIKNYLKNTYERYKIEKIQQQFSPSNTQDAFGERKNPDKYELIVATKNKENKLEKKEIRFDPNGNLLETRKIIRRSYDFLLF